MVTRSPTCAANVTDRYRSPWQRIPSRCTLRGVATVNSNTSNASSDSGIRGSHPPATHRLAGVCPVSGCTRWWWVSTR